ncbi:MAG: DUF2948 family protein [Paracoccus sp. (in: a-proteobacteria)]|uniref:DUF2948 family protein n=1 Tax=Paracoccus sp. TaxID=267 RepID=UPI0026DFCEB3|nr:DUF2948 family protein [Paracoccus sp. (in: a-proteobacteria)]MDO5621586.1 DUF2948 family protein [Paracoccus sp. (in: a-proteobacteria)]
MTDASFHDADPAPLALRAEDTEDLRVIATLAQDAILTVGDLTYDRRGRRFSALLNRFRWEDADAARREDRPYERVRALLVISDVVAVRSDGIARDDAGLVLSLLDLEWQPGEDGTGRLILNLAGDGAIALDVECLSVDLRDVTRPYAAVSGQMPTHD